MSSKKTGLRTALHNAMNGLNAIQEEDNDLIIKVRDGLFLAASRTYGEQYIEPFIRRKYGFDEPESNDHDAVDREGKRYEIKACKVLKATKNGKKVKTVLGRVLFENNNIETNRLIPFSDAMTAEYLANVQNVKRDHFDFLIYVLLFSDCIKIFFAKKKDIASGVFMNWSDKHGRYDELGKSGQFAIKKNTIAWHLEHYLKDTITYDEVTKIFQELSDEHDLSKKHNDSK